MDSRDIPFPSLSGDGVLAGAYRLGMHHPGSVRSSPSRSRSWLDDLFASVVVVLVALPLCMGIALASGVPPALGLVTGVVGGLVVGFLQGSPVSVSGPAAGLTVLVAEIVREGGLALLSAVVLAAGLLQFAAGLARRGRWSRAVPPSLVHGMLAGIGLLIIAGQVHVMVGAPPRDSGLANLLAVPRSFAKVLLGDGPHTEAALVGLLTIAVLLAWRRWASGRVGLVPATLVGVVAATALANLAGLPVARVAVPDQLLTATHPVSRDILGLLGRLDTWGRALVLALVASAETLLCAGAVDRLHQGRRTDYDRELRAQGIGNLICGALGALPMTAVIVRSSANVRAGGHSRASTIFHAVWILALVTLAPGVLRLVPISSLAAVLVFTGWMLIDRDAIRQLAGHGRGELAVYAVTVVGMVATDLLTGVLLGLLAAAGMLLFRLSHIDVDLAHDPASARTTLRLRGSATFVRLPALAAALDQVAPERELHMHLDEVGHMDHAALDLLTGWVRAHRARGGLVTMVPALPVAAGSPGAAENR
ncbi:MAG: sulfate transporter family protein [Chloroflexi bacterium]|nr:sulfate transporter family protein [Chloroflexota bacterium]